MEKEFIYWRHVASCGVKLEEVSGGAEKKGKVWRMLAMQVYCENGIDGFRVVEHTDSGAPLLADTQTRISITHTDGLLVVASLPKTPEADLAEFGVRTALGVDTERWDREKVKGLRERFLSAEELEIVDAESVEKNIIAWTSKEALLKAGLRNDVDWRRDITITELPDPASGRLGKGTIKNGKGEEIPMELYCYDSDGYCVTIAYCPKCAKFKKR